jgi:hypothetical protein
MTTKKKLLLAGAGISVLAAGYCFLWIVSSSHLAADTCGNYSLFHDVARCRQPHLAMVLTLVFTIVGGAFGIKALRS